MSLIQNTQPPHNLEYAPILNTIVYSNFTTDTISNIQ